MKKTKLKKLSLFTVLCCLVFFTQNLYSQVGINTESPNRLSELDVQNIVNGTDTIPKGIMVPRITQKLRDQIDVTDKSIANGLFIYNIDEDCYNYYSKEDKEWKSLCGKLGNAQFDPVDCNDITVKGIYIQDKSVDASNYLVIRVNVKKTGNYTINGTTGNGYFFTTSGTVLETGALTIYVPAQGMPNQAQTDYVNLTGITLLNNCLPEIIVKAPTATYTINCSSIVVSGDYYKNEQLNSTHYISVNVNVSNPGTYSITSNSVNGIQFSAEGAFDGKGTKSVKLMGTGTPTVNENFEITITTNTTEGNSQCTTTIPIILPSMKFAVIGNGRYSWSTDSPERTAALNSSNGSFSPNDKVKIKSFTQLWATTNVTTAASWLTNGYSDGSFPDVVLYFAYGASPNLAVTNALVDYINKGGCVIYGSSDNTASAVNILLKGVFGIETAQNQIAGNPIYDNPYPINNLPDDPIINGPFGNIAGKDWGEDNDSNNSIILTSLPSNSVQICSAYNPYGKPSVNPEYSIVWYNDSKNFVYFGDCVATIGTSTGYQNDYPSCYISGIPSSKFYGNYPQLSGAPSKYVYNSALELNAVSWAIKKAAISGINPY